VVKAAGGEAPLFERPDPMLERLDDFDWSRLSHAYGEATNVPELLRDLASPDRDERENAFDALYWSIHHQGTIYDSSAPAVPFLLELLGSPQVQGRHRILALLEALAGGSGYVQVHGRLDPAEKQASAEFQNELAQERSCQEAVQAAVWQGWNLFLELLRSPETRLRRGTLRLLRCLLCHPRPELPAAVGDLISLLSQKTPAKAGVLRLLAHVARCHAAPEAAREASLDHHEHEIELFNGGGAEEESTETPAWLQPGDEERGHSQACVAAIWRGWPGYTDQTQDHSGKVREGALFLQAILLRHAAGQAGPEIDLEPTRARLLTTWIRRARKAKCERWQADLLFALAAVGSDDPAVQAALREHLENTRSRFVGYVAALKLADLQAELPERGLDLLLEGHFGAPDIYAWVRKLPRWENYLAIPRLRLAPAVFERCLGRLVEVVRRAGETGSPGSAGMTREILSLAFPDPLPAGTTGTDLTQGQRQLLQAVADNGLYWGRMSNNDLELERYGLPEERRGLRRFLAGPGEAVSGPTNDPEDALVMFERLVGRALPFAAAQDLFQREEGDTRAPFRLIQENVERMRRIEESYRPRDRPQIEKLEVCGYACDALMPLVPLCPNLRELDLAWGEVTDAGLIHLARLAHLEKLDLYQSWITDAGLAHLAGLTGLRELALGGTEITDEGLRHLAGLTKVARMHLGATHIRGPGLAHLAGFRCLEDLWFRSDRLTDQATPLIASFVALKKLYYGGPWISGRGLDTWGSLRELRDLDLSGPLTVEALATLPALPALASLGFWKVPLSDAHVRALPVLPALGSLELNHSAITDAALEDIDRFPALHRLNLSYTRVTDACVRQILKLKNVTWVGLFETRVSGRAVEELKRAFPEAAFGR
jgi:hypothetical protein